MKGLWFVALVLALTCVSVSHQVQHPDADIEDNEFAEFEEFDEDESDDTTADDRTEHTLPDSTASMDTDVDEDDATVEDEDDEFDHFTDDEEFEGFDKERPGKGQSKEKPPDLKITKIPLHLRTNWDSFLMEMLMLAGLGVYFLNFLAGKSKNHKLAQAWLTSHRELLDSNFSLVGDDGTSTEAQPGVLMKESDNVYALWCSGRTCVEGMLVELKLLKRQDLVNTISRIFKPASDQIMVTVNMDPNAMEKFVFAVALKRTCGKLSREMNDLSLFCQEKKASDRFDLPQNYQMLSEIGEATTAIMDKKVCQVLTKYEGLVEYMHFSDQFSGPKPQDDSQPSKLPDGKPVLIFCFNLPGKGSTSTADMEDLKPLLRLVFYCVDKVNKMNLSKEARSKAEKHRQKAEETFLKQAHTQRQEAAQLRREEKRRAEKERILNEEDPEKARKLEEREHRKEMKKKHPKIKLLKT